MHCFSVMEDHVQQKTVHVISLLLLTRDYFTDIFLEKDSSQQQSISVRLLGCLPNTLIQSHDHHMPTLRRSNFCERLTNSVSRHFLPKSKQLRCHLKTLSDEQGLKLPRFHESFLQQVVLWILANFMLQSEFVIIVLHLYCKMEVNEECDLVISHYSILVYCINGFL